MTQYRIMVVEDENLVKEYICSHLQSMNYQVVSSASSGEKAISEAEKFRPDLVLMDIRIKGRLDGIATADHIRKHFRIPTVYLTAYSDDKTLERAKLTQPLGFLMKPFERSELKSTIEIALFKNEMDKKLEDSERKFRSVFENSLDPIYISTREGKLLEINDACSKFFGCSKKVLLKLNLKELYYKPSAQKVFQKTLEKKGSVKAYELQLKKKDGTPITGLVSASVIKDNKNTITGYQGIIHDITEKKRIEEQLFQAVKMGAIGRLASGIAHDFNNLLTVIIGYAENLSLTIKDKTQAGSIMKILLAGKKAAELIKKILAFSRKQESNPTVININETIFEMEEMVRRIIGENIRVHMNLGEEIHNIFVDPSQLEQIIMNIIVNARDAMPRGGSITIKTENQYRDEEFVKAHIGAKSGEFVQLDIRDTGHGIDPRHMDKIFEPFFTTKIREEGTGLGLATVYGIVKQNNGYIYAESKMGRGTSIKILFPIIDKSILESDHQMIIEKKTIFNNMVVLLVEDEKIVRDLTARIFESLGFQTLSVEGGEEAIKVAELHKEPIDLLFTDVVLLDISGEKVAEKLKKIHPETKVLFTSGYPEEYIAKQGVDITKNHFIKKPYLENDISQKVREVLKGDQENPEGKVVDHRNRRTRSKS